MRRLAFLRLAAFGIDWLCIVAWGALLFGIVMVVSGGEPVGGRGPWQDQVLGFLAMTLPVVLAFAWRDARGGTPGKLLLRLQVVTVGGGFPRFRTALLRNAVKFLPWECGHLVAQHAIHSGDEGLSPWVWVVAVFAFGGPLLWLAALFTTAVTPYDAWAGTRVVRR